MPIGARRPATSYDTRANEVRNHEAGMLVIGLGAVLLIVSLFLEWYQRGTDAFEAFEVWDLVLLTLAVGALVAVASRFGFGPPRPAGWLIGPAVSALVIVLFALLNPPPAVTGISDDPSIGIWLALTAAILMSAGALLSVARISVALAAPGDAPDRVRRRPAPVAEPLAREPVAPTAPAAAPATEPTRRI